MNNTKTKKERAIDKELEYLNSREIQIYRGKGFSNHYANYYFSDSGKKFSQYLNERKLRVENKTFSSRLINHWEKIGLIEDTRSDVQGWRKFSVMESVWLQIVSELRGFGLSLDTILNVRYHLTHNRDKYEFAEYPLLEFYVTAALMKKPVLLLVTKSGDAEPVFSLEYYNLKDFLCSIPSHIVIDLNVVVQRIYKSIDLKPVHAFTVDLTKEEEELFMMLYLGNYNRITITHRNGKIEMLEGTEEVKAGEKISTLLRERKFQKIELIQRDGKVVSVKRTIRKKV